MPYRPYPENIVETQVLVCAVWEICIFEDSVEKLGRFLKSYMFDELRHKISKDTVLEKKDSLEGGRNALKDYTKVAYENTE